LPQGAIAETPDRVEDAGRRFQQKRATNRFVAPVVVGNAARFESGAPFARAAAHDRRAAGSWPATRLASRFKRH